MKITFECNSPEDVAALKAMLSNWGNGDVPTPVVPAPIFGMSVEDIPGLSARTINALKAINITTVGQIADVGQQGILKSPNVGRKSLTEVINCLGHLGVVLGHYGRGRE